MFRCKDKAGVIREVSYFYIDNAWLPAVTSCQQHIYLKYKNKARVNDVRGLNLTEDSNQVSVTWIPNVNFMTEVQYRMDDGEWVTLPLVEAGVGEV